MFIYRGVGAGDHLYFIAIASDRSACLFASSIIFFAARLRRATKTGSLSNRSVFMLITEKSLKSRFRAIFASILLTAPPNFADRIETIIKGVTSDSLDNLGLANAIEITIVAIAIGAYWHQDLQEVRSRILGLQVHSQADIQELVLAYAIALACRDELKSSSFINQICHDFHKRKLLSRNPESQKNCLDQLQLAQKFVNQGASAIAAHRTNGLGLGLSDAIASSLYYFLSTTHSWQIVTDRAHKHNLQIAIQSGAIAAAYLGAIGNIANQNQKILTKGAIIGEQVWTEWAGVFDVKLDN
jgi:hypothetical protein